MAEFLEVMKQENRMCEGKCINCPLSASNNGINESCWAFNKTHPKEVEKIVMDWAKEHPFVSNKDKFKEVFGFEPSDDCCPYSEEHEQCIQNCCICKEASFWEKEYKEPKENGIV